MDHQAFVPIGLLKPGTRVKTHLDQIQTIVSLHPRPGPAEKVYNLEVHGEHVYYVGDDGILVHNSCGTYVYAVLDKNWNAIYIGTGTFARTKTALARIAKDLGVRGGAKGMEAAGYTIVRQDIGTKAAARAAENYLIGKTTKGGRKFTKPKTPYDKSSDDLLNKEWGTKWDRKSEGADDWFNGFWPEIMNRTGTAWKAVDGWFS